MENLMIGIELMVIGMCTVFAILIIVIQLSRLLIALVNRLSPASAEPAKTASSAQPVAQDIQAVLSAAVAQITQGRGRITKITKL